MKNFVTPLNTHPTTRPACPVLKDAAFVNRKLAVKTVSQDSFSNMVLVKIVLREPI